MLNRHYPQYNISGARSIPLPEGCQLNLRIFIDRSSIEVFVNQGEYTLSSRYYAPQDARSLRLFAMSGEAILLSGEYWRLNHIG